MEFLPQKMEVVLRLHPREGTPRKSLLRRFAGLVLGVLSGLERLVIRGKLWPRYAPQGMNTYLSANHVLRKEFKRHAEEVTARVLQSSLLGHAKEQGCFAYLNSTNIDKDQVARGFAEKQGVRAGLVCVLQC